MNKEIKELIEACEELINRATPSGKGDSYLISASRVFVLKEKLEKVYKLPIK